MVRPDPRNASVILAEYFFSPKVTVTIFTDGALARVFVLRRSKVQKDRKAEVECVMASV